MLPVHKPILLAPLTTHTAAADLSVLSLRRIKLEIRPNRKPAFRNPDTVENVDNVGYPIVVPG